MELKRKHNDKVQVYLQSLHALQLYSTIHVAAMQITLKMDAVVKWLTVSLATLILQLHYSQPMYEHIMNDDETIFL